MSPRPVTQNLLSPSLSLRIVFRSQNIRIRRKGRTGLGVHRNRAYTSRSHRPGSYHESRPSNSRRLSRRGLPRSRLEFHGDQKERERDHKRGEVELKRTLVETRYLFCQTTSVTGSPSPHGVVSLSVFLRDPTSFSDSLPIHIHSTVFVRLLTKQTYLKSPESSFPRKG